MDLINCFKDYIKKEKLVNRNERLLLGVSGGPDSLTMLDLFNRIKEEFNLKLFVFHLNHMFRDEAEDDARYVEDICSTLGIRSFIETYNVPVLISESGLSPEEAAREIRLKKLQERASSLDLNKVVLAHNKNDLVETILLNMIRGTGLKGLAGITPRTNFENVEIIHPLLSLNRYEIESYCEERGLEPRIDHTNQETIYTRNKIRHKIIPYIEEEINPGFKDVMVRMAEVIREEENFLDKIAEEELENLVLTAGQDNITLALTKLEGLPRVIRTRVLQKVIYDLKEKSYDLYYKHFQILEDLIKNSTTGKKLDLPGGITVIRVYDKLLIKRGGYSTEIKDYSLYLDVPGQIELPVGEQVLETEVVPKNKGWSNRAGEQDICFCDFDLVKLPLVVRNRRPGDRFNPLGMSGSKKIKDFFIDEKLPRISREQIPLVISECGRIIWVAGLRMDDRFKVTDETTRILKIKLSDGGKINEGDGKRYRQDNNQ